VKPSYRLRERERIEVTLLTPPPLEHPAEAIPLDILYEDSCLLVVNKPAGLVVHPAPGHCQGTLVNALLYHCRILSDGGGVERPGIVHRLDKETSGVLVVAKDTETHQALAWQFKEHTIRRNYLALVMGSLKKNRGEVDLPIGRDHWHRKKISPRTTRPKEALTRYRVVERFERATLLEVSPATGRTHQIRVHLASLSHPVAGDRLYGGAKAMVLGGVTIERHMLHAQLLGFRHPKRQEYCEFIVSPPADMMEVLARLRSGAHD
jgi:23S rRNA pseudouridine1911/1915/1917 synthase